MGQAAAHCPQPAQIAGSMATVSPAGKIAPVGHRSRQRVQPVFWFREWAQRSGVKSMYFGLSKMPTIWPASATSAATAAGSRGSARR